MTLDPADVISSFRAAGGAVREVVAALDRETMRRRTDRPGQYFLDTVADAAALEQLASLGAAIVSEESGRSGDPNAPITVVLDPVDGSTNASRGLSYWATSICALDDDGPLAAFVVNQATGEENVAIRGVGATRDGQPLSPSSIEATEDAVLVFSGRPPSTLRWKQYRVLGCAALTLCDVAAGGVDAAIDGGAWHAPWDYLGGLLICREAGATVIDGDGAELITADPTARRRIIAASTPALLEALRAAGAFS